MDRVRAFRQKYESAGVLIEIVKYDGIYNMADDEVDYCFNLARTLGARAISCEIDLKHTQRIGQFADKHKLMVGFHGHAATIAGSLGDGVQPGKIQRREPRYRSFRGRQQYVSRSVSQAASCAHHAHPRQGSENEGRPERAVRPRGHADQRSAPADPRQQVADAGHHRVRISRCRLDRIAWPSSPSAWSSAGKR